MKKGTRCLFMVHREEIIKAISARFTENDVPHGIIKSGYPYQPWHLVQIASVQTLAAKIKKIRNSDYYVPGTPIMTPFGIILTDEAHHSTARQYLSVYETFPNAIKIGTSVGGDSRVLIDVLGVQSYTTMREMWNAISPDSTEGEVCVKNVKVRAFNGKEFCWKPLKSIMKHHIKNKKCFRVRCEKGRDLLLTEDHSIYRVIRGEKDDMPGKKVCGVLSLVKGGDLRVGDYLLLEDATSSTEIKTSIHVPDYVSDVEYLVFGNFSVWIKKNITNKNGYKEAHKVRYQRIKQSERGVFVNRGEYLQCGGRGLMALPGIGHTCKTEIPVSAIAYLLGFYVGDGWTHGRRVCFAVETKMQDRILDEIKLLRKYAEFSVFVRKMPGKSVEVRVSSAILSSLFSGLCPGRAWEKEVPKAAFSFSDKSLRKFIDGMLDSDGHLSIKSQGRRSYTYTTTSKKLADGFCEILKRVKVVAGIHATNPARGGVIDGRQIVGKRIRYDVFFSAYALEDNGFFFTPGRQPFSIRTAFKGTPAKILSITEEHEEWVYDFSVKDRRWQTFVANGILVHNTATAQRLDGRGLGEVYQVIVQGPGTRRLIEEGWLAPYAIAHGDTHIDTSKFHLDGKGEFNNAEMAAEFDKTQLIGEVFDKWEQFAYGKQTLVFAVNRKHARHIHESFVENGVRAAYVDGKTDRHPGGERDQIFKRFASKEITVLVNVELAGEGVDIPGIDCVVMARATNSLTMWLQAVGRCLRPVFSPGMPQGTPEERKASIAASSKPYAIIIDHGFNYDRLHFPDHQHEWSLEGRAKRAKPTIQSIKQCTGTLPSGVPCTFVGPSQTRVCPLCGFVFTPTVEIPEHKDGEMVLHMPGDAPPPPPPTKKQLAAMALEAEKKFLADALIIQEQRRYLMSGAMNPKYNPKEALKAFKRQFEKWPNEKHGVVKEWKREMNQHAGHFIPRLIWWEMDGVRYWCERAAV